MKAWMRLVVALMMATLSAAQAPAAITMRVKIACRGDYYRYCSSYAVPSPALRSCMRSVKDKLASGCLRALMTAGEISESDLRAYRVDREL